MTSGLTVRWQDWTSFGLGLWLALSPWVLGYLEHEGATANAVFLGVALALGCQFEASIEELSAEWLNLMAGLWLVAAPFVLGFTSAPVAMGSPLRPCRWMSEC